MGQQYAGEQPRLGHGHRVTAPSGSDVSCCQPSLRPLSFGKHTPQSGQLTRYHISCEVGSRGSAIATSKHMPLTAMRWLHEPPCQVLSLGSSAVIPPPHCLFSLVRNPVQQHSISKEATEKSVGMELFVPGLEGERKRSTRPAMRVLTAGTL